MHTPSLPACDALPATKAAERYEPAAQLCTAATRPVFAVVVHAVDTNWPVIGAAQDATGQVELVPALAPEAV